MWNLVLSSRNEHFRWAQESSLGEVAPHLVSKPLVLQLELLAGRLQCSVLSSLCPAGF